MRQTNAMSLPLLPTLLLALLLSLFAVPAYALDAATVNASYIDRDGNQATRSDAHELTSTQTTLEGGWWVVNQDVTVKERLNITSETNLILVDKTALTASDGICVGPGASLTIWAQSRDKGTTGTIYATSSNYSAIGGNPDTTGGRIAINGGSIYAEGGYKSAGIGGSAQGTITNLEINDGFVVAYGWRNDLPNSPSYDAGAGIGGGYHGNGFPVTINDGTVYAKGGFGSAGIGGGHGEGGNGCTINGGTVTAIGGDRGAGIGGGAAGRSQGVHIKGGTVTAQGGERAAGIGGGYDAYSDGITIDGGTVTAIGGAYGAGIGGGMNGHSTQIWINGGTVVAKAISPQQGWGAAAAIGGGYEADFASEMIVTGGDITAIGARGGAGIGAGTKANMTGSLKVTGGIVRAYGGASAQKGVGSDANRGAAGIGGGEEIDTNNGGEGGTVIIEGGTVIACGGGGWRCAIGHGHNDRVMGELTIADHMWTRWTNDVTVGTQQKDYTFSAPTVNEDNLTPSWTANRAYDPQNMRYAIIEVCPHPSSDASYIDSTTTEHELNYDCAYCKAGRVGSMQAHDFTKGPDPHTCICGHKEHAVTFHNEDGSVYVATDYYVAGTALKKPDQDPAKEGHVFLGWFRKTGDQYAARAFNFYIPVSSDLDLYPQWAKDVVKHTVTFRDHKGNAVETRSVESGSPAGDPPTPADRTGYAFVGWYEKDADGSWAEAPYDFAQPVTADVELWSKWTLDVSYGVVFHPENGTNSWSASVRKGERVARPDDPERDGHEFVGWYRRDGDALSPDPFDFSTAIEGPVSLYADWKPATHTVAFDARGGAFPEGAFEDPERSMQAVEHGKPATRPADPTLEDHAFAGWTLDGRSYGFGDPVTSDITLVAEWERLCTVTFDSAGGTAVGSQTIRSGSKAEKPADPTRDHHTFAGWFAGTGDADEFDFEEPVEEDMRLVAHWTPNSHTVTFEPNYEGAPEAASQEVAHGGHVRKDNVAQPTREPDDEAPDGWLFAGWYKEKACTNPYDFSAPVTSDLKAWAKWVKRELNSYVVTFDAAGGTAVDPQHVKDGSTATIPISPTRTGHDFAGWYLGDAEQPYDFHTPVTDDITLVAHWTPLTYIVAFNAHGGTSVADKTVAYANTVPTDGIDTTREPDDEAPDGWLFAGWYIDVECTRPFDFATPVTSNLELHAKWVKREVDRFVVAFDSAGGTAVDPQSVKDGETATVPIQTRREGYEFVGWYLGDAEEPYDFATPVSSDLTLVAHWNVNVLLVTFDLNYAGAPESPASQEVTYADRVKRNVDGIEPVREPDDEAPAGWIFAGWHANAQCTFPYDFETKVTEAMTLYAKWVKREVIIRTVTFDSAGGTAVDPQFVRDGTTAEAPSAPTRTGHVFEGWFLDDSEQPYDFQAPVTGDITLVARWTPNTFNVTFDSAGGSPVDPQTVAYGDFATRPAEPFRDGHAFVGWALGDESYGFDVPVTGDVELVAQWVELPKVYVVAFDLAGGSATEAQAVEAQHVEEGDSATRPESDPAREHYNFVGWFLGDEPYDFNAPVTSDITLVARWTPDVYRVTFDLNYEGAPTSPASQDVAYGERVRRDVEGIEPSREADDEAKLGWLFAGWYTSTQGNDPYDFSTPVTNNLTLYAKWVAREPGTFVVSFDAAGGTDVDPQQVTEGQSATKPDEPMREGHDFEGWFLGEQAYDFDAPVTEDIELVARWTIRTYTVTLDLNYEGAPQPPATQSVEHGDKAERPAEPTREGYAFAGWTLGGESYGFDVPVTSDITLTAQWLRVLTVAFDPAGGSPVSSQSVIEGTCAAEPDAPTRDHHTFADWLLGGQPYDFSAPVADNITLIARWEPDVQRVTFHLNYAGAPASPASQDVTYGGRVRRDVEGIEPTRPADSGAPDGWLFAGWYADARCSRPYDFATPVKGDLDLYAKWVKVEPTTFIVTFDSAGGTAIDPQEVRSGSKATKPRDPKRNGYKFAGWRRGGKAYDFSSPVTRDIRLVAQWTANPKPAPDPTPTEPHVGYEASVAGSGWGATARDGATAGTTGQRKQVEALRVRIDGGSVEYRSHVQGTGWESSWAADGTTSGRAGSGRRVEAVQMRLKGELAQTHDVFYRVHSQRLGWLGWAKGGEPAGTSGRSLRAEAVQVVVLPKGQVPEGYDAKRPAYVAFAVGKAHVQRLGWQGVTQAGVAGTTGRSLRLEALSLSLVSQPWAGGIECQSHLQGTGWEPGWAAGGATSGTVGESRRIEAVRIRLTGELTDHLSVWYRVHAQRQGWLGWTRDGEAAGTSGMSLRAEAVEVRILPKGATAPGATGGAFLER